MGLFDVFRLSFDDPLELELRVSPFSPVGKRAGEIETDDGISWVQCKCFLVPIDRLGQLSGLGEIAFEQRKRGRIVGIVAGLLTKFLLVLIFGSFVERN